MTAPLVRTSVRENVVDQAGYRKIKRHKPNLQQWLRLNDKPETVRHIHAYHDAIENGDVVTEIEYVPLDLSKAQDRAYLRVQTKRMRRKQKARRN